ncbi:M24 family metallopeptidase [archaeon]|nr:MAG: M24 family metallopeptidase [archaeon]
MYTRVLQGHIAIATAIFPSHTPGCLLDSLARLALWRGGRVFNHGVGHGVGAALNVHEGPQSISAKLENSTPLQVPMLNELFWQSVAYSTLVDCMSV